MRPGGDKRSLEVVMQGLAAAVPDRKAPAVPAAPGPAGLYAINLQRSMRPGESLPASVPHEFQDNVVFTSRQVANGQTAYDTNVGYFRTMPEAQRALEVLRKLFPQAAIITVVQARPFARAEAGPVPVTPAPALAPDVDAQAMQRLAQAQALYASGDAAGAIEALNAILALPPNAASRPAQELIGDARAKAGDPSRARVEYELFLKLYPDGADSNRVKGKLAALPQLEAARTRTAEVAPPVITTSGSISAFYFGGQSQVRTQEFQDSPIAGLPALASDSTLAGADLKQAQTNLDLNWRYRDADKDMRLVVRDSYSDDLLRNRNKNRLSALYFERRSAEEGSNLRVGRQSPSGGGVLFRFDGVQGGYTFAPKWRVNAVAGVPSDPLLDTHRHFYGLSVDAEALTPHLSGNLYFIEQTVDSEIDRRAIGTEWRYFDNGLSLTGQVDYDQVFSGLNIVSVQCNWQATSATIYNFMYDRRATPIRSLSNTLFFQDPTLTTPAQRISDLLQTVSIQQLQDRAASITPFQTQAMAGFTTRVADNWQTGADLRYTKVDAIEPVPVILPNGQPSTGDLWSVGAQLIGSNLYSVRDTHVFNANYITGPTFKGQLLAYNNLTSVNGQWQLEPALRYYTQRDNADTKSQRWTPGLRVTYRIRPQLAIESEATYEIAKTRGPARTEDSRRTFYFVGGRYDF